MALRLRRGTDTERQLITPVQGELIYTTDTKRLYVGDGTTAGGIAVDEEVLLTLGELLDVESTPASDGDILSWNDGDSAWGPISIESALNATSINSLIDVDTETDTPADGNVLAWDAGLSAWSTTELDMLINSVSISELLDVDTVTIPANDGDVLAWDPIETSWIPTSSSEILNANSINQLSDVDTITTEPAEGDILSWSDLTDSWQVSTVGDSLSFASLNDLSDVDTEFPEDNDVLTWDSSIQQWVPREGTEGQGVIEGSSYRINIIGDDSTIIVNSATNEHVGFFDGQFVGDLQGNVIAEDSSIMVDWLTKTVSANIVTGSIFAEQNYIGILPDEDTLPGSSVEVRQTSLDAPSVLRLANQTTNSGIIEDGALRFSRIDSGGSVSTSGTITSTISEILIARRAAGGGFPSSHIVALTEQGHLVVGGLSGTEKLSVNGNAAIDGSITATEFVQFGSYSTANRPTGVNGMVIYNNTAHRFQGFQDGAWINLDDGSAA